MAALQRSRGNSGGGFRELPVRVEAANRRVMRVWRVAARTLARIQRHRTPLAAAGCAFYATLALFPALGVLVSLYGLAFDPASVERQMRLLDGLLPPDALSLISGQVARLVARPPASLGLGLAVALAAALWSSSAGTRAMLMSLNVAYGTGERRGWLRFQATGLAITGAGIVGAVLALATLVALPAAAAFLHLAGYLLDWLHVASLGVLLAYVAALLGFLYRFGPSPARHAGRPRRRLLAGAVLATVLWLSAAAGVSLYISDFSGFDATYGPLATFVGVMLWLWVSSLVVLTGAELNAVLGAGGE